MVQKYHSHGSIEDGLARLYTPLDMQPSPSERSKLRVDRLRTDHVDFIWNGKLCVGNRLHQRIQHLDADENEDEDAALVDIRRLLDANPKGLESRFTYSEGSAQAIHLAATRSSVAVVELLLQRKADVNAWVTRAGNPYYNVLTAAVFSENRGGSPEVVKCLLDNKANMAPNTLDLWPLHFAFVVGSTCLIELLRGHMQEKGLREKDYECGETTPLKLGIRHARMTSDMLSLYAPVTPDSLRTFIHHMPECVLPFLARAMQYKRVPSDVLAKTIGKEELRKVFMESPEAGCALLYAMSSDPSCECPRWHPLPKRVNFSQYSCCDLLRNMFNDPEWLMTCYTTDRDWKFNMETGKAPQWHEQFATETAADMFPSGKLADAEFKVCHLPNIICPEIFQSFSDATDETLFMFDHMMVRGLVNYVWWQGASRVILLRAFCRLWELAILLLSAYMAAQKGYSFGSDEITRLTIFVGYRGIVDLVHEIALFLGHWRAGMMAEYGTSGYLGKLFDWAMAATSILLITHPCNRIILMFAAFARWLMLWQVFLVADKIARIVVPLHRLLVSVVPATLLTLTAFAAICHAMFCLQDEAYREETSVSLRDFYYSMFSLLFTNELPDYDFSDMQSVLVYLSTLLFSIFYMNIFIAILGEQYSREMQSTSVVITHRRAAMCYTFLLRAKVLPTSFCSGGVSLLIIIFSTVLALAIEVACWMKGGLFFGARPWFFFCQLIMYLASFQNPSEAWVTKSPQRHFWLIFPKQQDHFASQSREEQLNSLASWGVHVQMYQKQATDFFLQTPMHAKLRHALSLTQLSRTSSPKSQAGSQMNLAACHVTL
eukprot:TRINITY_DN101762_c0_g1_i1.p1 TRINITY_DN101762_c0_g1~~TRINITY_DN101762_c0_g1_i1.p1  ORF type:complete len:830 (-),score=152.78 TRINITY_DN101762_c0_g1_i1:45-2534(-)